MLAADGDKEDRARAAPAPPHDALLMQRIVRRDVAAFEQLYRAMHGRLSRFVTNMVRQPQTVEEVVNDTMLVVWTKPESFAGTSKLSTWIFGIAYRKALKALARHDEPVDDSHLSSLADTHHGPEALARHHLLGHSIGTAMAALMPIHRAVVELAYVHDMGYREIAEIMECPVDTVKTRMFHARRKLQRSLQNGPAEWL